MLCIILVVPVCQSLTLTLHKYFCVILLTLSKSLIIFIHSFVHKLKKETKNGTIHRSVRYVGRGMYEKRETMMQKKVKRDIRHRICTFHLCAMCVFESFPTHYYYHYLSISTYVYFAVWLRLWVFLSVGRTQAIYLHTNCPVFLDSGAISINTFSLYWRWHW